MPKYRNLEHCVINSDNVQPNAVINTEINDTAIGLLWGCEVNSGKMGFYFIMKGEIMPVKAAAQLSEVKDTAGKLNLYFEGGTLKFQNKLGSTLYLYVKFEALTE